MNRERVDRAEGEEDRDSALASGVGEDDMTIHQIREAQLRDAACAGDDLAINKELAQGTAVDSADCGGVTALMMAAERGHERTVTLLCQAGASLTLTDRKGMSALEYAGRKGQTSVAAFLLKKGCPRNLCGLASLGMAKEIEEELQSFEISPVR